MKFTKEEISLCKHVREKDLLLKPVKEGDWIRNEYGKPSTDLVTSEYIRNTLIFIDIKHWFPLWTIPDCLEFWRRNPRIQVVEIVWDITKFKAYVSIRPYGSHDGKTVLEGCLKAVLAVLEERK